MPFGIGLGNSVSFRATTTPVVIDFNVALDPNTLSIDQGSSGEIDVTLSLGPDGSDQTTSEINVIGLPTGVTAIVADETIQTDGGTTTITLNVAADAPPVTLDSFSVQVVAPSQTRSRSGTVTVVEVEPPSGNFFAGSENNYAGSEADYAGAT